MYIADTDIALPGFFASCDFFWLKYAFEIEIIMLIDPSKETR